MYYDARDIARYIVSICTSSGKPISNLQLQKILYYVQLSFLHNLNYRAFYNTIEAWDYGPVVPDVYNQYKYYGSTKIYQKFQGLEVMFTDNELLVIKSVVSKCISLRPWDLVEMSHEDDSPWDRVYNGGRGYKHEIPVEYLEEYAMQG